jgi:hypothetical protein
VSEPVWSKEESYRWAGRKVRPGRPVPTAREKVGLGLSLVSVLFLAGPVMLAPFGLAFSVGGPVVARPGRTGIGTVAVVVGVLMTVVLLLTMFAPV